MTRTEALLLIVGALICASMTGCRATRTPEATDRDGIGTPIGSACAHLRLLGCPEGSPLIKPDETCYEHMSRVSGFVEVPSGCLADAGSIEIARACGGPDTLRVRCNLKDGGS